MQTRSRNIFTSIHTEGSLLPVDLLQRVLSGGKDLGGLVPADYHLPEGEKLNEAVNRSWNRLQGAWSAFQISKGRLKEGDPGTTLTRERWLLPLFQELGYGRLATTKAIEIEGKAYPISHGWANVPIHLVGCGIDLDRRAAGVAGASKSSPHSLVQELLNQADDRQWGIASNGLRLRILRDNASLTRQAYLEFDLEAMFAGEVYADFVLLWLFCHQSRFESGEGKTEGCWLEKWSKAAQERGTRALDQLRNGVEEAIKALGSGFLAHPANHGLRAQLRSGKFSTQDYYRQLLRLVYRLIFLFAAEDRDLLLNPQAETASRDRYIRYYSTARLRRLAERQRGGRHADLWQGLKLVTDLLGGKGEGSSACPGLGLPVLNGFLFSDKALPDLEASQVDNQALLNAIRSLAFTVEGSSRRAVDYKNLGPEELGSVYESLLELHPILNSEAGTFELTSVSGHERKTTGSYYTPTSLIQVLLDSALDPVIEQAVKNAGPSSENQQSALLNLKVCDPACGSGHFLIAAAHRIARRLAQIQAGGDEPPPTALRSALRSVIAHCIYGVDVNPMAVELCKVNLWLESIEPGKPLSFLDAHIQCGDSLVGVSPGLDIQEIPDDAFNPAFGDDKSTSSVLKKRNKRERGGQLGFRWKVTELTSAEDLRRWRAERLGQVDAMPEDDPAQVQAKAQAYYEFQGTQEYIQNRLEYDLWTAAFFWHIPGGSGRTAGDAEHMLAPTQQELVMLRSGGSPDATLVEKVRQMAERLKFFHWELAFPQVFTGKAPGFNCVLGNPPWERIKLQEEEFFASRDLEIATALNKAARQKKIDALTYSNPALATAFEDAKHAADSTSKFVRDSTRFSLTAVGDVNTYALFAELYRTLVARNGRAGIIVPTGIATDDTNKVFFGDVIEKNSLICLYDFANLENLFPAVDANMRFSLIVMTTENAQQQSAEFVFLATRAEHIKVLERRIVLSKSDFLTINPNTRNCPMFRTRQDAELTKRIYRRVPVLQDESRGIDFWGVRFSTMFHMANDSHFFRTEEDLIRDGYELRGNSYYRGDNISYPLYEGKMFNHFDHRYAHAEEPKTGHKIRGTSTKIGEKEHQNPNILALPRYWVSKIDVDKKLHPETKYLLAFRDVAGSVTNVRTAVFALLPRVAAGHKAPLVFLEKNKNPKLIACFLGNLNSLVLDYIVRQKVGGISLSYFIVKQLPILPLSAYTPADIEFIASRVLELVYTAYDLKPFAEDMGYYGEPFRWDVDRRALLRAELDAYYARLYSLTRDELRYILDPQDVYGPDFPGETFRVLKEKEIRQFGEYRTRRLVLEAWDRLEGEEPVPNYVPTAAPDRPEKPETPAAVDKTAAVEASPAPNARPKKEPAPPEAQPMLTDFGLYKCEVCGKMVMGFEKENHEREKHRSQNVEWKKIR